MEKKHHRIDDLFRQGLTNLEIIPSETGRSGFLQQAGRELKTRSVRKWLLPVLGIILGVGIITGIYLFSSTNGELKNVSPQSDRPEIIKGTENTQNRSFSQIVADSAQIIADKNRRSTSFKQRESSLHPRESARNKKYISGKPHIMYGLTNPPATLSASSVHLNSTTLNSQTKEPLTNIQTHSLTLNEGTSIVIASPAVNDSFSKNRKQVTDSVKNPASSSSIKKPVKPSSVPVKNRNWNIFAGIYYTPEWIFNTLDKNKYVNNFGVEAQFQFGNYSVRTGVGLSITRGFNEIAINTKPYLGGYSALDFITYHWDAKHYHLIPTVFTTWKEVFDTALHNNSYTREKEYTYLQVPLILGYDFYKTRWVSLGARVGPVMSILIKSRELSSGYDAGKDIVISVNNITPDRIHLNWQALAGVNGSFHLSRRFIIELEPNIRYYFDSVYEKSGSANKPWSVGFRTALLINF
ncbi:MAG: hypothetical protein NTX61_16785 [Bacteroidetes bacterium]|nr:hypothetical protein [Bacteroidota bacterium]